MTSFITSYFHHVTNTITLLLTFHVPSNAEGYNNIGIRFTSRITDSSTCYAGELIDSFASLFIVV